ncbi:hypothetical protein H4J59_15070 [Colwellia sp. MB02u-10]|nr:hypothetical protein [Colwellia sp. MB02u-10]MBA6342314.1 hypothetical protein [Colwellia sp. MB02u-10]
MSELTIDQSAPNFTEEFTEKFTEKMIRHFTANARLYSPFIMLVAT